MLKNDMKTVFRTTEDFDPEEYWERLDKTDLKGKPAEVQIDFPNSFSG